MYPNHFIVLVLSIYFVVGDTLADFDHHPGFTFVGQFGGKVYFAEKNKSRTHAEANTICNAGGFSLVSLQSKEEYAFLRRQIRWNERYWLSAKDTSTYRWENGEGENLNTVKFPVRGEHNQNCILLHYGAWGPELYADPCDGSEDATHTYWPLCETWASSWKKEDFILPIGHAFKTALSLSEIFGLYIDA